MASPACAPPASSSTGSNPKPPSIVLSGRSRPVRTSRSDRFPARPSRSLTVPRPHRLTTHNTKLSSRLSNKQVAKRDIDRPVLSLDDDIAGQPAEPKLAEIGPQ